MLTMKQLIILMRIYPWRRRRLYSFSTSKENEAEDIHGQIENNTSSFYRKYAVKINQLQASNREEYNTRLQSLHKSKMPENSEKLKDLVSRSWSPSDNTGSHKVYDLYKLDDVMKIELVKDMSPEDIGKIWSEYHNKLDCLYSVIKEKDYDIMEETSKRLPLFLYPLPRQDGYEFFLSQFIGSCCCFTTLHAYQKLQENAVPRLTLVHYTELKPHKGIVLMAGSYDKQLLTMTEAVSLARQMSLYYSSQDGCLYDLLHQFNKQPDTFRHSDLITQFHKYKEFVQQTDGSFDS